MRLLLLIAISLALVPPLALAGEFRGTPGNDTLVGTRGSDLLVGLDGNDELFGGKGDDRLDGGDDHDRLFGGDGDDLLVDGGEGPRFWDQLVGGAGNDRLIGGPGADVLRGNRGNDVLDGRDPVRRSLSVALDPPRDRDFELGGPGDDLILTRDGRIDVAGSCGPGRDTVIGDRIDLAAGDCEIVRGARRL